MHTVDCCANNCATAPLCSAYEQAQHVEIITYGCLGVCDVCAHTPFAFVGGTQVAAHSVDEVKAAIDQCISDIEAFDAWFEAHDAPRP
ncbi:MAG: DUF1450 domain-containing protein [Paenibacillaceae bacterium]|jgi:uncharacterized protein YuzB (UPF0349 family)|nr:DUF1450 domain-containing protein [Paenibacillaceae bacterium]